MNACQICDSTAGKQWIVAERMFGSGEQFTYFECAECGCLQLVDVPEDLSRFYPPDRYYSHQEERVQTRSGNALRQWLKRGRDNAILFGSGGLFAALARRWPNPTLTQLHDWFRLTGIRSRDASVLDVGCGDGALLKQFTELGFTNLTGVDPFRKDSEQQGGLKLLASSLEDLAQEQFDLIMLHHTFEHMPEPKRALQQIAGMLSDQGACVIRIPVKSDGPWKRYGTEWAEIDAPRHLFLYTEESLGRVVEQAGLKVHEVHYEDEPFAYLASELYQKGIALEEVQDGSRMAWERFFSLEEIQRLSDLSRENNVSGRASRAAFVLKAM